MTIGRPETESAGPITPPAPNLVIRNIATLGAGELLSRLIGFAVTIYIARRLGVEAYGIIGFGFAILLYASAIVDAGLEHTGPREVVDAGDSAGDLLSSLVLARLVWGMVVAALLVLGSMLFFTGDERLVLTLYALALVPLGANTRWFHIGRQRSGIVSASRVGSELVRLIVVIALVRNAADVGSVPLAQIAGDVFAALLLIAGVRGSGVSLRRHFDAALAVRVLRRAAPMAATGLLAVMIYNVDLIFLRIFRDTSELGLYLAGYTILNFLGVLGHVVALALVPTLARLRSSPREFDSLISNASAQVFAGAVPLAVGGAIVAPLLVAVVFGDAYLPAADVLAVLVWSLPILLVRSVYQAALIAHGRQDHVLRATIAAAVTNVGLNFVAVPLFGMLGAAVTTVISDAVRFAAALAYSRRAGVPQVQLTRLARSVAAAAVMAAALLLIRPASLWVALPLGAVAYLVGLILTGAIRVRRDGVSVRV